MLLPVREERECVARLSSSDASSEEAGKEDEGEDVSHSTQFLSEEVVVHNVLVGDKVLLRLGQQLQGVP